jgi:hypothetical protein
MSDLFTPAPEPPTELGRYRVLSSTAGARVSPLCLGAMSIGDAWSGVSSNVEHESARGSRPEPSMKLNSMNKLCLFLIMRLT